MTTLSCPKIVQAVYRPRRPEKTPLFQVIKKNYLAWHKKREDVENPVPNYVSNVFTKFLGCGILAKGFACAHCDGAWGPCPIRGLHRRVKPATKDFFLAFSCKARGICPSCNQRSMVDTYIS